MILSFLALCNRGQVSKWLAVSHKSMDAMKTYQHPTKMQMKRKRKWLIRLKKLNLLHFSHKDNLEFWWLHFAILTSNPIINNTNGFEDY